MVEERGDCYNQQVTAMSTFRPAGSLSSNDIRKCVCVCVHACMCVDGMNLKCALHWHICISVYSVLCQCIHTHTHMRILIPFEDSELTGLKVDTAQVTCP